MGKVTAASQRRDALATLAIQGVFAALLAVYGTYDGGADASRRSTGNSTAEDDVVDKFYPMFQDVHVMIYIGFGFLMTFLKKYCYSATGFTLLLGAMLVQWAVLCKGFFHLDPVDHKIHIGIESLLNADIAVAAVLISMGAVLGKTTPLQLLVMGIIEIVAFTSNEYIGVNIFKAVDAGGSMYVHVFGAYFGLGASLALQHGKVLAAESGGGGGSSNEGASYTSDTFAMIGSIFLWLFWPSFNAGLCVGDERHRAVINTYFSLASCCVVAFATSALLGKDHKLNMVHIQNSTLAGGVAIGTVANMMVYPYGALLIGAAAGVLSVIGYHYIQPFLLRSVKLHDTCGVHYLHGLPGVLAGAAGAAAAAAAGERDYGRALHAVFPARAPGEGRTAGAQAGYQLLALGVSALFAGVSGAATGVIVRTGCLKSIPTRQLFSDASFWLVNEDEQISKQSPVFRLPEDHATASSDSISIPV
ncbi:ammonium transporter Rh type A isoform X2 [Bacillus rossius redtenbacheri]|uniref:ammonium transporter Rh type A isoform X2 n=1 Tax=Bacillus rossius redtenbacheri TaxID=93214 RepID=UPI002FDD4505